MSQSIGEIVTQKREGVDREAFAGIRKGTDERTRTRTRRHSSIYKISDLCMQKHHQRKQLAERASIGNRKLPMSINH